MYQRESGSLGAADSIGGRFDVEGKAGRSVGEASAQQQDGKHGRESEQR